MEINLIRYDHADRDELKFYPNLIKLVLKSGDFKTKMIECDICDDHDVFTVVEKTTLQQLIKNRHK